jgi:hypothetical protein
MTLYYFLNIYTYLKLEDIVTYACLYIITQNNPPPPFFIAHLSISDTMNFGYNENILVSPDFHYNRGGLYIYFWDRFHQYNWYAACSTSKHLPNLLGLPIFWQWT